MTLEIELVWHMDAGDRNTWSFEQDRRPLTELGQRQAERFALAIVSGPVDALYSSPALRCRQTLQPLADHFGLPITDLPGLHEAGEMLPPVTWRRRQIFPHDDPLGGAYYAGRAMQALRTIHAEHATGRVVACTHGDTGPQLVMYLAGAWGIELPSPHATRGGWYTLRLSDGRIDVEQHPVPEDFPL